MFYSKSDGQYIQEGQAFQINDLFYPANWLNLSTPEEKLAIGLEEVVATNSPANDTYYWVSSTLDKASLTYTNTPKDLVGLKTQYVTQTKDTAGKLLSQTDWVIIRKAERGVEVPSEVALKRTQIVAEANRLEVDINGAINVEALIEVLNGQNWGN